MPVSKRDCETGEALNVVLGQVGPPLVTQGSEEEAEEEFPGSAVDSLSHRHQIRLAALRRQQAVYGSTSPTIFVTSFLVMVGPFCIGLICAVAGLGFLTDI
jgi:hypothetical protein